MKCREITCYQEAAPGWKFCSPKCAPLTKLLNRNEHNAPAKVKKSALKPASYDVAAKLYTMQAEELNRRNQARQRYQSYLKLQTDRHPFMNPNSLKNLWRGGRAKAKPDTNHYGLTRAEILALVVS